MNIMDTGLSELWIASLSLLGEVPIVTSNSLRMMIDLGILYFYFTF